MGNKNKFLNKIVIKSNIFVVKLNFGAWCSTVDVLVA